MNDDIINLAYKFWSIEPKNIPKDKDMPVDFKGGKRAWFYAKEITKIISHYNNQENIKCIECGSFGFRPSVSIEGCCHFCDGTIGGLNG